MISPHLEPLDGEIDAVRVQVSENDLLLHFPYHKQAVDWVKRIEGAEYHSHDKSWSFVVTEDNTLALRDLVDELREFFRREQEKASCVNCAALILPTMWQPAWRPVTGFRD